VDTASKEQHFLGQMNRTDLCRVVLGVNKAQCWGAITSLTRCLHMGYHMAVAHVSASRRCLQVVVVGQYTHASSPSIDTSLPLVTYDFGHAGSGAPSEPGGQHGAAPFAAMVGSGLRAMRSA
jgi:hypothetical protein